MTPEDRRRPLICQRWSYALCSLQHGETTSVWFHHVHVDRFLSSWLNESVSKHFASLASDQSFPKYLDLRELLMIPPTRQAAQLQSQSRCPEISVERVLSKNILASNTIGDCTVLLSKSFRVRISSPSQFRFYHSFYTMSPFCFERSVGAGSYISTEPRSERCRWRREEEVRTGKLMYCKFYRQRQTCETGARQNKMGMRSFKGKGTRKICLIIRCERINDPREEDSGKNLDE